MAWTFIMLTLALGLMVSAFIGWRRECRDEAARPSAKGSDGEGAGFRMTGRAQATGARHAYADAKP